MTRKFTFTILAMLFAILGPGAEAWGQEQTVTMSYSGSTTTNMTGNNDAATVGLNASSWSVVASKGGNDNFPGLNKNGQIRLYGSATNHNVITVTNLDEATITTIKVTYGSSNYNAKVTVGGSEVTGTGSNTEKNYNINSSSFSIAHNYTNNTQVYILSIEINYSTGGPSTVSAPTFTPAGGTYYEDKTIELSAEEGCTIYYTLNGDTPTAESTEYSTPIQLAVPSTTTIKAIAVDGESNSSNVASATYTLKRTQYTPEQLLAEVEPDNQSYTVIFTDKTITEYYIHNNQTQGFYFGNFLVYCNNNVPDWEIGGKVSGTVTGIWKTYNTLKEFCPTSYDDFSYTPPTQQLPTPTGLEVSNLSMTGATLSWNAVEHASSYTVHVMDLEKYENTIEDIENTNVVIDDLTAGTEYMWTVQAIGDGETYLNSEIAEGEVFETPTTVLYTVHFEPQQTGGTININPVQAAAGDEVFAMATAAEHYSFTQWNFNPEVTITTGEITGDFITFIMPAYNVTVSATFTEDTKYTVTYAKGGADVTGDDPETVSYYVYDEVILEENPYTRTGFSFDGWEVKDAGGNEPLVYEGGFVMPASNVTVTATWAEKTQYTVSYVSLGTQIGTEQVYKGDLCANVPTVSNIPTGWTFLGWTTGSADNTTTAPEPFDLTTPIISATTLNAVFTKTEGTGIGAWEETPLENITSSDVFVMVGTNNKLLQNNNKTAVSATIEDGQVTTAIIDDYKWNVTEEDGSYVFNANGSTNVLYFTNDNNGVKFGTPQSSSESTKYFTQNNSGYIVGTDGSNTRYLSYYATNNDWRCYKNTSNNPIVMKFYKLNTGTTYYTTVAPASEYAIAIDENIQHGTIEVENALTAAEAGTEITLIVTPAEHYSLTPNSLTVTGESSATVEVTPVPGEVIKYTFVMPAEAVTVTAQFTENPKFTVSCYANGTLVSTEQVYAGEMQLTEPANVPNGFTYVGYATEEISGVAESATYFSSYNVTEDVDLYAVFAIAETGGTTSVTKDIIAEAGLTSSVTLNADNNPYQMGELPITLTGIKGTSNFPALNYNSTNGTDLRFYKGTTCGVTFATTNNSTITKIEFKKNVSTASNLGSTFSANVGTLSANVWTGSAESVTISYSADATYKEQMYIINVTYSENSPSTYSNFCTTVKLIDKDETISENATWEGNYTINGNTVTIGSGAVLTVNGALINTDPKKLIIEDGAQLIVNNSGLQATMKKHIENTPSRDDPARSWYTVSSPLAASTEFANVTNLIPNNVTDTDYDLYRFDEKNGMWINSRIYDTDGTTVIENENFKTIDKGVGYIYSNAATTDIAFEGEVNVTNVECTLTNDAAHGFNLIGNPFAQNIKLTDVTGTAVLAEGFYVLTNQNTWGTEPMKGEIKPLQGFLVQAKTAGNVTISKPAAKSKGERSNEQSTNIEMIVSNASFKDNAYAMFGEGTGLNKVSHRNAQAPMLYVPQDGENFAIAFMDENTTIFPVSFKAMTTGSYSISLKATDDVSTLVLVDNMTGEETNMLLEDSYTFIGSPADNENRFTVKLKISNSQDEDEHFAYQNGSELVVNGEGTLQIFDVLGRMVISEEVHGQTVNVGGLNTGAYIVRLTGESVKTQKIVVR